MTNRGNAGALAPDHPRTSIRQHLVSAHFNIETPASGYSDVITEINAGIAVITPAKAIRELLIREDLAEERRRKTTNAAEGEPAAAYDIAGQEASKGHQAPVE
jgi:hypothetical protein